MPWLSSTTHDLRTMGGEKSKVKTIKSRGDSEVLLEGKKRTTETLASHGGKHGEDPKDAVETNKSIEDEATKTYLGIDHPTHTSGPPFGPVHSGGSDDRTKILRS